jgi:hypothetical protein
VAGLDTSISKTDHQNVRLFLVSQESLQLACFGSNCAGGAWVDYLPLNDL